MVDQHQKHHTHSDDEGALQRKSVENFTGSELPFRNLYLAGIALTVVSIAIALAVFPLNDLLIARADKQWEGEIIPDQSRSDRARLQPHPEGDWRVFELLMHEKLNSYGWQDQAAGIVRIPVDRAVELALAEHLIGSTDDAVPAVLRNGGSVDHEADSHAQVGFVENSHEAAQAAQAENASSLERAEANH